MLRSKKRVLVNAVYWRELGLGVKQHACAHASARQLERRLCLCIEVEAEVVGERHVLAHVEERQWHHVGAHQDLELTCAVEEVDKVSEAEHVQVIHHGHDSVQQLAGVEGWVWEG